ncbi:MAG: hypothetical protein CVT88_00040 [Candidatus Altiarchaeales archaeon HGW-Altiarchaeales-1]|nr:MAG: hypothetical protein CVT88_00040 [Candidatus Altiarchaeales archaeon HGW-Altiarchaeales-1]
MENFNKFKGAMGCILIALFFVLLLAGNTSAENKTTECDKTISGFLQIENLTAVDENYKKAEQSLENTTNECKNDSLLFKILGVIIGIALGLVLTKKWIDRMKYEHIYKVPDFIWILKTGGMITVAGIILIIIIGLIIGIDTLTNILF